MSLLKFGDYEFPRTGLQVSTNFGQTLPNYVRMAGLQGARRLEGYGLAVQGEGIIEVSGEIFSDSRDPYGMLSKRNALRGLKQYGVQRLIYTDGNMARYCYAECTNASLSEDRARLGDWQQAYSVTFIAVEPIWYLRNDETMPWRFDSGYTFGETRGGDSLRFGTGFQDDTNTGSRLLKTGPMGLTPAEYDSTSKIWNYEIEHEGTVQTWLTLAVRLDATMGSTDSDIRISRLSGGILRDRIILGSRDQANSHGAGAQYDISGQINLFSLNAKRLLPDNGEFLKPHFLQLDPGENRIEIYNMDSNETWRIFHWWDDAYA